MAERRMFAKTIIDSDAFLDMPLSAQALYFHLSMRADDDGFVNNPKKIQRMVGASDDDCKLLVLKRFILTFESGIIVIKHWKIHNYIQKDRYKETVYLQEKATLGLNENNAYTECIQGVHELDTQVRKVKVIDSQEIEKGNSKVKKKASKTAPASFDRLIGDYAKGNAEIVELLIEWLKVRKAKRAAMTDRAIELNLQKLDSLAAESGLSVVDYLKEVICRGWQAFYPIKNFDAPAPKQSGIMDDFNRMNEKIINGDLF